MKILVIGKGKMGNLIYEGLKEKYQNDKKIYIDQISFDKEVCPKKEYDYIIDFSHPDSINYYRNIVSQRTKIVIGTTGFSNQQNEFLEFLSKMNPIVKDVNFSKGLILLKEILFNIKNKIINYNILIEEKHHKSKVDSPSGTAIVLSKILKGDLIKSVRDEDYINEHKIVLNNNFEQLEISHLVQDKKIYFKGIEESMDFLHNQKSGLFTYTDVLKWN